MTPRTHSKNNDINSRNMSLRARDRVEIVAGKNQGTFGSFVNYQALDWCYVRLDGLAHHQRFLRTSVMAAMANMAPPLLAIPVAGPAVPDWPPVGEGPPVRPVDPRVQDLLLELHRVKSALSVLETKLGAMTI